MKERDGDLVRAGTLAELEARGVLTVPGETGAIAVFRVDGVPHAVDNRCPHLGFPLARGTVRDGVLVCHWHHARFDLSCGGTLDPWADDVRPHRVRIRDGEVWVSRRPEPRDPVAHATARLGEGLEHDLTLVLAKGVIALDDAGADYRVPLEVGARHGAVGRAEGWGPGLSILTIAANLLPWLAEPDRPRALVHGLVQVAADTSGRPPRRPLRPLPGSGAPPERLKRWLRELVEVRDAEGVERVLASAVEARLPPAALADMVHAAATDRVYLDGGHALDFAGKAFELLDHLGWDEHAAALIPALAAPLAGGARMEESASWRSPADLIELRHAAVERLPRPDPREGAWMGPVRLVERLLGDDPEGALAGIEESLAAGATAGELAEAVAYAAALRLARFPVTNELGDWDTALHTFTFAGAVLQGLGRAPSQELLRGVVDGALSVYRDRFLNVPPAPLPGPAPVEPERAPAILAELAAATDTQQQVDRAGALCAAYLDTGADPVPLRRALGELLLREDAHFHTFQALEAGFALEARLGRGSPAGRDVLVAVARYLAAHAPTPRALGQTYRTALRLHRGEPVHESAPDARQHPA